MSGSDLEQLFEHELEDIYFAEHELVDALEELAEQVDDEEAERALLDHRDTTEEQANRIEEVFDMISEPPDEEECEAIEGILEEQRHFAEDDPGQEVLDLVNLTTAQKAEHYEIAAYGNLAVLADRLDMEEAGDVLHRNLEEEKEFLQELKDLTEEYESERLSAQ